VLVDVAHNPLGAEALAAYLASSGSRPMRRAVCGVLGDKDAGAMLRALVPEIDVWYFASLPGSRGRDARELAGKLPCAVPGLAFDSVEAAFEAALEHRSGREEIVVFGSFVTVERALRLATSSICPET
jgi:dihydrofolate synthase/folylpolyglutamate synthase